MWQFALFYKTGAIFDYIIEGKYESDTTATFPSINYESPVYPLIFLCSFYAHAPQEDLVCTVGTCCFDTYEIR
jgi:hypothetical protein